MRTILLLISFTFCVTACGQYYKLTGKVTNAKQEPLAFVSIQVKELRTGTITKEDGTYELELEEGKYDLVVTMTGYKQQVITIIITNTDSRQDVNMEVAGSALSEVTVTGRVRNRAEEYIRNVIRNKDNIESAAGAYSCKVYIKALQQDSMPAKKNKKPANDSVIKQNDNAELNSMAMAEIVLNLDHGSAKNIKEERTGIKRMGNTGSLFFLSTTEGDFNFYNNLISIPSLSQTPFLSPLSYSGLLAYRYKTLKTEIINGRKIFTISIKPTKLSNATVEGEITIADSIWVVLHTKLRLPKYHLAAYDLFEVEQQYDLINDTAWMITRQEFTYNAASGKRKLSGRTTVTYNNFELNKQFERKHFGMEVSSSTAASYARDSTFWQKNRTEPLTEKEIRLINYKDSIYRAAHTEAYLDSLDRKINKITWKNVLLFGQNYHDHTKNKTWYVPPIPNLYQPFQFGGSRIQLSFVYSKIYKSRKNLGLYSDISYGLRNKDVNGSVRFNRMYNPFNRGSYTVRLQKSFDYIFTGDAWINMISRNNFYLNQGFGLGHRIEIANGLFLNSDMDMAFRRSLSGYKTNDKLDSSVLGNLFDNNHAVAFSPYNAFYGALKLEYTPRQRYIREPKEKVILGSAWPTFYVLWKKGIPRLFSSKVDFDYLEFGMTQSIKIGLFGTSSYTIKTGSFLNTNDLELVDYKRERRGDPIFFSNPNEAFQSLDSTFPLFHRFYEAHYVHEFNGAILNKIPLL